MRRNGPRGAVLGGTVILTMIAVAACGRGGSSDTTPVPTISPSSPASAVPASAGDSFVLSDSPSASDSASPTPPTPAQLPTPDPLASALDAINQLINDINDSLTSSDGGGE